MNILLNGCDWVKLWAKHTLAQDHVCRAMVCIIAAYAVMRCMSVCLSVRVSVTFVYSVKTSKQTSNFCHHLVAMHIHNFSVRNLMALFRQGPPPLTRASCAGGLWKNRYFRSVSRFVACCQRCDRQMLWTDCRRTVASWWHLSVEFVYNTPVIHALPYLRDR